MPNTKLVFIKLLLELADDPRFVMHLNDSEKLDYLLLLLMAGLTHNDIPKNYEWFKSRFNLQKNASEIQNNLDKIQKTFPKITTYKGNLKFKNFKRLHNYIYKEKENLTSKLKEFYKNSTIESNLFSFLSSLISYYIKVKKLDEGHVDDRERGRYGNAIKKLLIKAKGDGELVKRSIDWASKQTWCDWTLETIIRRWADFMADKPKRERYDRQILPHTTA